MRFDFDTMNGGLPVDLSGTFDVTNRNEIGACWATNCQNTSISINTNDSYNSLAKNSGKFDNTTNTLAISLIAAKADPNKPNKLTISMWVRPVTPQGSDRVLAYYGNSTLLGLNVNNNIISCYLNNPGGTSCTNNTITGAGITLGKWSNITIVYDTSNVTAYVDGKQFGSPYSYGGLVALPNWLTFGGTTNPADIGNGRSSYSDIDDIMVYHSGLTASEVGKIYAMGAIEHGLAVDR
jgi:hypothetical protein